MRALLLIACSLALTGCTFLDGGRDGEAEESKTDDPFDALDAPHFLVGIEVSGPHPAAVKLRLVSPEGNPVFDGDVTVPAGERKQVAVPLGSEGTQRVLLSYSWTQDGRAASGSTEASFDSRTCTGVMLVGFAIDTTADATRSSATTLCQAE